MVIKKKSECVVKGQKSRILRVKEKVLGGGVRKRIGVVAGGGFKCNKTLTIVL